MPSLWQALSLNVCLAIMSHYLWFKPYEPSSYATIAAAITLISSPIAYLLHPLCSSIVLASLLAGSAFITALLASVVVYRISPWHPLASVPGPLICKVTRIWTAYIAWTGGTHRYQSMLHQKYGDIVRIGPNDISVTDKNLFGQILGPHGMPKGPVWDARRVVTSRIASGHRNLHAVRDLQLHAELRKPWNKAFGKEPMGDYEAVMVKNTAILIDTLHDLCRKQGEGRACLDVARWLSLHSFDSMGDMVFSRSFNLMSDGDFKGVWEVTQRSLIWPHFAQHIPWISGIRTIFPSIMDPYNAFGAFVSSQAKARAASSDLAQRDLFYHLIKNTDVEPGASILPVIMSDAVLAIFAGSDTTAFMLSCIVYYLVRHPEWQRRVKEEVDHLCTSSGDNLLDVDALAGLEGLNSVINETLRLQPPVPTLLQRAPTPGSGGLYLGNLFIPESTTVQVPPYAVHRSPRYFSPDAKDFRPERWLKNPSSTWGLSQRIDVGSQDSAILDRSAFIPFSMGPANCAGKVLAMKQLRYITAQLLREFELKPMDGWDLDQFEELLQDRFLMVKGKLPIWIVPRERGE